MKSIFWIAAFIAAAAQAQSHPNYVEVVLIGIGCEKVSNVIYVVRNGDEAHPFPVTRSSACTWRGPSLRPLDESDHFSLRLGGARTQVRPKSRLTENDTVLQLEFVQPSRQASDVYVESRDAANEWVDVDYLRRVRPADPATDRVYDEQGKLRVNSNRIADVSFDLEELRLKLTGRDPGLLVNPLLAKTKFVLLKSNNLVDTLTKQAGGNSRSAPNNASAQREAYRKLVSDSRIDRMELTKR